MEPGEMVWNLLLLVSVAHEKKKGKKGISNKTIGRRWFETLITFHPVWNLNHIPPCLVTCACISISHSSIYGNLQMINIKEQNCISYNRSPLDSKLREGLIIAIQLQDRYIFFLFHKKNHCCITTSKGNPHCRNGETCFYPSRILMKICYWLALLL